MLAQVDNVKKNEAARLQEMGDFPGRFAEASLDLNEAKNLRKEFGEKYIIELHQYKTCLEAYGPSKAKLIARIEALEKADIASKAKDGEAPSKPKRPRCSL